MLGALNALFGRTRSTIETTAESTERGVRPEGVTFINNSSALKTSPEKLDRNFAQLAVGRSGLARFDRGEEMLRSPAKAACQVASNVADV